MRVYDNAHPNGKPLGKAKPRPMKLIATTGAGEVSDPDNYRINLPIRTIKSNQIFLRGKGAK